MSESPVGLSYVGIPGYVIFWVLFLVAVGFFVQRLYFLFRLMRLGGPENRYDNKLKRLKAMLFEVVPQWCNLKSVSRKDLAGIGHALLFWGFSFISSVISSLSVLPAVSVFQLSKAPHSRQFISQSWI